MTERNVSGFTYVQMVNDGGVFLQGGMYTRCIYIYICIWFHESLGRFIAHPAAAPKGVLDFVLACFFFFFYIFPLSEILPRKESALCTCSVMLA